MCGIVGYIGKKEALPILINGLKALEYRGYDSTGAIIQDAQGKITLRKDIGAPSVITQKLAILMTFPTCQGGKYFG